MARPTTPSWYDVFGGLNLESSSEISNFEAKELTNLYLVNRGQELQRRKGTDVLRDWEQEAVVDLIDGLEWVQINSTAHLIATWGGDVYDALSGTAIVSGGADRFPSWDEVNGTVLSNKLYLGNGIDQNCRWDGSAVKQVMPSGAPTGTVLNDGGAGGLTGTYSYRITFLSADGIDSAPSAETGTFAVASKQISLTSIPTAASTENVTGRRIWRIVNGGSTYFLVATISDNTTTTYVDNISDATISAGTELDTSTVRFPPVRYLVNHQERLCGVYSGASEGDTDTLYVSNFQEPEVCPLIAPLDEVDDPTQGIRIPLAASGTAVCSFGNALLVWTKGACYRLTGDNPNNWSFDKWLDNGCISHRTVRSHRNMLLWLAGDGVYMAEGWGQVTRISDPIREDLEAFTAAALGQAHAFIWEDRYYLCSTSGAFYYDLRFRTWGEIDGWTIRASAVSENTGSLRERIFGSDSLEVKVWEMETGTDDDGEEIEAIWQSKDKDLGHFGREKRVHRVVVGFKTGTGTATVKLFRSGELLDTFTHDLSTVNRTGSEISTLDDRASEGARDEFFRLSVTCSTDASDYRILRAGWHFSLAT
jgi:hypothetical protein